jgi:hypothetical protein
MTEFRPRFFHSDAEIEHLGEGLLARTLSRDEWTHEAHLAATTYLLLRRPDVDLDRELPTIIRRFNKSVDGVRLFLAEADPKEPLDELVNELLLSPMGRRDWPLRFYTRDRLLSVKARRDFIPPDLAALP